MKLKEFDDIFVPLDDYLKQTKNYLSSDVYDYLNKFIDTHVVLPKSKMIYFDDPSELDEVFSSVLLLPKNQVDNLKCIITNDLRGVCLESSFNHMYPYEYNCGYDYDYYMKEWFISISTSRDNLFVYSTISIDIRNDSKVPLVLIGRDGVPIIKHDTDTQDSVKCGNTPKAPAFANNISELNNISLYSDADNVKINDVSKYLIDKIFNTVDLLVLNDCPKNVIDNAYYIAIIKNFVDLALNNIYSKVLSNSINNIVNGVLHYDEDGTFTYEYKGVTFEGMLGYNKDRSTLLLTSFNAINYDGNHRFVSFVERELLNTLEDIPIQISNQVKNLGKLINLLENVVNNKICELKDSLSDKKQEMNSALRNYPIDLMSGTLNTIITKCLLDATNYLL